MSSQKSIRTFANGILATEAKIDVLVLNAGIAQSFKKYQSVDGIELTMATNHYGPFLLTHLLIDLIKKSEQGRIIVVSSKFYQFVASMNLNNLNPINFPFPVHLYSISKFANIMFTQELARRLKDTKVTANCLHPGVIDTGIWRNMPFPISIPFKLVKMCFKTAFEGAQTQIYLAVSPDVEHITGKYFRACKIYGLNNRVQNQDVASKLWEASRDIAKLTPMDPQI